MSSIFTEAAGEAACTNGRYFLLQPPGDWSHQNICDLLGCILVCPESKINSAVFQDSVLQQTHPSRRCHCPFHFSPYRSTSCFRRATPCHHSCFHNCHHSWIEYWQSSNHFPIFFYVWISSINRMSFNKNFCCRFVYFFLFWSQRFRIVFSLYFNHDWLHITVYCNICTVYCIFSSKC